MLIMNFTGGVLGSSCVGSIGYGKKVLNKNELHMLGKQRFFVNNTLYIRWCAQTCLYRIYIIVLLLQDQLFLCCPCEQVNKPQTVKHGCLNYVKGNTKMMNPLMQIIITVCGCGSNHLRKLKYKEE